MHAFSLWFQKVAPPDAVATPDEWRETQALTVEQLREDCRAMPTASCKMHSGAEQRAVSARAAGLWGGATWRELMHSSGSTMSAVKRLGIRSTSDGAGWSTICAGCDLDRIRQKFLLLDDGLANSIHECAFRLFVRLGRCVRARQRG